MSRTPVPIIDGKRVCAHCNAPKLLEEFRTSYRDEGKIVYRWCKQCTREDARTQRLNPKPEATRIALVAAKTAIVLERKSNPCADCGGRFDPVAMDFDHVRGRKVLNISALSRQQWSMEKLLEELEKCELVCANCHRVRTAKRDWLGRSRKDKAAISLSLGGAPVVDETGRRYETLTEASEATGVGITDITSILKGNFRQCNGHTFCYAEDVTPERLLEMSKVKPRKRKVRDKATGIVYGSLNNASKVLGITKATITISATRNRPTKDGREFEFVV